MDLTNALIVLGLVVTAIPAIHELVMYLRERNDLQIIPEYYHSTGYGTSFQVILVKHGKKAVSIEDVLLNLKLDGNFSYAELRNKNIHFDTVLPQTLQENDPPLRLLFPLHFLQEDGTLKPSGIRRIEVKTLGKRYRFPSRSLRSQLKFLKLKRQVKSQATSPGESIRP